MSELKKKVAEKALSYIDDNMIIGVGTGSTVNYFIEALVSEKHKIDACVASSKQTEALLKEHKIPVIDLNVASQVDIYIDGADEVNQLGEMIKGGGGALTREKIVAFASRKFVCIVDQSKIVSSLGSFPIAIEVIPMARSLVAREIVKLGGDPVYREDYITDNGNIILDIHNLKILEPMAMENKINMIPGVVENGIFANIRADEVLVAYEDGVRKLTI